MTNSAPSPSAPEPLMSRSVPRARSARDASGSVSGNKGFWLAQTAIWAVAHFAFCFVLQVSELFAPFLLIVGIGWGLVPHIIGLANGTFDTSTADPQTRELIAHISHSFPMKIDVAGHVFTPHGLVVDGFLLMALAALCATACAWLGRRL